MQLWEGGVWDMLGRRSEGHKRDLDRVQQRRICERVRRTEKRTNRRMNKQINV